MSPGVRINYKEPRKLNPEAARTAVLEYLKTNKGNIADAARVFGIQRPVVYDIIKKAKEGDLKDRSRAPKNQPNKTPSTIEEKVIEVKNATRLGPKRLAINLKKYHGVNVAPGTIRHILRRNKDKISYKLKNYHKHKEKREFVDWYKAKPFEIVQVDVKFIRDQKALSKAQIIHLDQFNIPNFQWSALDVNSRFKLIAYSREKTWTNGLCWFLWVLSYLRSSGVKAEIIFTVDNGEEVGGKSWIKVNDLRKLLSGFGAKLIQNHKGHCEENAHVERSHRTDDDEFYISRVMKINNEKDLLNEALGYIYYYNCVREHSSLDYKTPLEHLKMQLPEINDTIRFVQPFMLDDVSVKLGPWSGYNVLAQNQFSTKKGSKQYCPFLYPEFMDLQRLCFLDLRCY